MTGQKRTELQSLARVLSHDMASLIRSARQLSAYAREDVLREDADAAMHALGMLDVRLAGLDRLVGELLRYQRAGQRVLQWEPFSISELLQAEYARLAPPANARLLLNIAYDVVVNDRALVRTVIGEVFGNALAHHDNPHALVLSVDALRMRDGSTLIHIQDNGPGLPAGAAERVLEPFIKLGGKAGAAGLGLTICKRELEAAGGDIAIKPDADGCCVAVTLPPVPADLRCDDDDEDIVRSANRRPSLRLV